jgi:hypothetical protein
MYNHDTELMLILADERIRDLQQRTHRESPRFSLFARRPRTAPERPAQRATFTRRKAY